MSSPSTILSKYTINSSGTNDSILQSDDDNVFCNEDNVHECAAYLNQELESLGISVIEEEPSIVRLLNIVYELTQYNRTTTRKMDDITTSLYRARSDLTLQSEAVARLKSEEESLRKSISLQKEAERQLSQRNRVLSGNLKTEKEEVRRLQQRQQYEEQKYLHTIKKKDREYSRLKDRLGELVLNKSQEKRLGIKTLNTLQKHRKAWSTANKCGEDMYKLIVSHYGEREKELMLENASMRESLLNMEKELAMLLNDRLSTDYYTPAVHTVEEEEEVNGEQDTQATTELMDSGCFRMPFDITKEDIEQSLRDKYKKLREHIAQLKKRNSVINNPTSHSHVQFEAEASAAEDQRLDDYEAEIDTLLKQLSNYQEIIAQQEEVIKKGMESNGKTDGWKKGMPLLSPSKTIRRMEELETRESRMKERELLILTNEQKLMEATRNLDRERRDFEDRKGQFYKQQFLESSIFVTPSKTGPAQINSFFTGLSSTPFPSSAIRPKSIKYARTPQTKASIGTSSSSSFNGTPNKENIMFGGSPILRKDISMSSDEGTKVLN